MRSLNDLAAGISGPKFVKGIAKIALILWLSALIAEITIFVASPNEMMGWGEKPSLRRDPAYGWRLIESKTTRLRWLGYDYVVTSNSLGFPGPEYSQEKPPEVYRIMTVGSGFTSAEGVDTDQAWPRILEQILNERTPSQTVEVLNFAVSGYGPRQYAALVEEFGPVYRPDAIIVALIPNDLKKVLTPVESRARGIGFDRPNPNGAFAILTCQHFLRTTKNHAVRFIQENIKLRPNHLGYTLGQFWALERGHDAFFNESQAALEGHFKTILAVSQNLESQLLLIFVPASVQVCSPNQLAYFPRHISLDDPKRFDLDQPQQRMTESASRVGADFLDLRLAFGSPPDICPYHPKNLHWTRNGHQEVAEFIADRFTTSSGFPSLSRETGLDLFPGESS